MFIVPRLLLLFAFFIISCKIFYVIHMEVFKKNLCDDDFYSGGIDKSFSKPKTINNSYVKLDLNKSKRPDKIRPSAKNRHSTSSTRPVTYSSYEAYKKSVSNFR